MISTTLDSGEQIVNHNLGSHHEFFYENCLCRLNFVFLLWISMTFVCSGYPIGPSKSNNPFYLNCQLYGKSDYCLLLLNSCLAKVGRDEELALLKPHLETPLDKRSFRNGVGSGIKKTSFRRAKS
ncbi:neuropeptide S isoform X1 [Corapipo altera]|uniref:neuropeptide S isoform X1 n=1 Tax=Corapipo altera TaxID=415028 RepID=UPI000FD66C8C|nr:neuropeptide S isoform X1 [Corapipo altera]